jgi:hypothetical protein
MYVHYQGRLCWSRGLHDKIEQFPLFLKMYIEQLTTHLDCAQSNTWRLPYVARTTTKNVPNWESASKIQLSLN